MCLSIYFEVGTEYNLKSAVKNHKKVAEKDLYVFKHLRKINNKFVPPFRYYNSDLEYKEGFHYYQTTPKFSLAFRDLQYDKYIDGKTYKSVLEINEGLHAYTSSLYIDKYEYYAICIIPKGSTYYLNYNGREIVTDNLIIDKIIKPTV
jgi:hypothetical protein